MNTLVQTIAPQLFIGSLPLWYYHVRIGWLGMTYQDRISMRWLDAAALGVLAACGHLFLRQARVAGACPVVRLFRIAMLLSLSLAASLAFVVLLTFVMVPYVPAHFPPATPGTWISLTLELASPFAIVIAILSFAASLLYVLSPRNRTAHTHHMKDMMQVIAASQQDVIAAAEQKLGRTLNEAERRGIQSISSLMMLESCQQSFSSPVSTQAQVLADLAHFARKV